MTNPIGNIVMLGCNPVPREVFSYRDNSAVALIAPCGDKPDAICNG
jgi:hypothetical protein